jgi:hypothetical protein
MGYIIGPQQLFKGTYLFIAAIFESNYKIKDYGMLYKACRWEFNTF